MNTRNSSSSTILIILIVVITFPLWIALAGVLFGVVVGIFGAGIGIIAGIFGAMIALIALPFKLIFGWGHWGWHGGDWFGWYHFPGKTFFFVTLILIAALIARKRQRA